MQKIETTGTRLGLSGWTIELADHEAYFHHMAKSWTFLDHLWFWFRPKQTTKCIAYERPDGGVSVVHPSDQMIWMLKHGDIIRHMRQIDAFGPHGIPVFEGTGEFLPPMTEEQALEFIAWKDIPRGVNHRSFIEVASLPSREHRNRWTLTGDGRVAVAGMQ